MARSNKAPKDHWSEYYTTDEAAECLSYFKAPVFGDTTPENAALYSLLWNDIGPGLRLNKHWGKLSNAQQVELTAAFNREHPEF